MRHSLFSMGLLTTLVVLMGCPAPTTPGSSVPPTTRGNLTVNIAAPSGLLPHSTPAQHKVSGLGPQGATFEKEVSHSTSPSITISDLPTGAWTISVDSLNDLEESLGQGTQTAAVEVNKTVVVAVQVAPHTGQTGNLALNLSWLGLELANPGVEATLLSETGDALHLSFTVKSSNATYGNSLVPVGDHTLILKVLDGDTLISTLVETVKIISGVTTKGEHLVSQPGSVSVNLPSEAEDDLEVSLEGVQASKLAHRTLDLVANVDNTSNTTVVWYVDDAAVAVGPQFAFNPSWPAKQPAAPYTVRAVAYSADGKRKGSAEAPITITPVFQSVWKTDNVSTGSSDDKTVKLPFFSSTSTHYDYTVEWGDGTSTTVTPTSTVADVTHQYATPGTYTVVIYGTFKGWTNLADRKKLLRIESWGPLNLGNFGSYFQDCSNLTITATDRLDLTGTTNLGSAFENCTSLTTIPGIGDWDVSEVTNLGATFSGASQFNADLSGWDVGKVTTMTQLFRSAAQFNGDVSDWNTRSVTSMDSTFLGAKVFNRPLNWDTSSVITMAQMFAQVEEFNQPLNFDTSKVTILSSTFLGAKKFNGDIAGWDTSRVTSMFSLFSGALAFNGDVSGWNTGAVTTMASLFRNAIAFNGDVSAWDTKNVTSMQSMFEGASSFNRDLEAWDTSKVTNMGSLFLNATAFNGDITNWNTSNVISLYRAFAGAKNFQQDLDWDTGKVTSMEQTFKGAERFNGAIKNWNTQNVVNMGAMFSGATAFNQDLDWNTANVTSMAEMFRQATAFNGNITTWDTSKVKATSTMFNQATAFNQDLGSWNVTSIDSAALMFNGSGLSSSNYGSILTGWAAQAVKSSVNLGAGVIRYPASAAAARQTLVATKNWTISDGGQEP